MNTHTLIVKRDMRPVMAARRKAQLNVIISAGLELAEMLASALSLIGIVVGFYILAVCLMA